MSAGDDAAEAGVIRPVGNVRAGDVIRWVAQWVEVLDVVERSNGRRFRVLLGDGRIVRLHYFADETVRARP